MFGLGVRREVHGCCRSTGSSRVDVRLQGTWISPPSFSVFLLFNFFLDISVWWVGWLVGWI